MNLTKEDVIPFWKSILNIQNESDLESHLKHFFGDDIDRLVEKINSENAHKEINIESVKSDQEKQDFFKKEFDLFLSRLNNIIGSCEFLMDKDKFSESQHHQLEKIIENDLWYFLIDEATLYFKENNTKFKKINGEKALQIFIEEVFHTKRFRSQCEILYPDLFALINLRINHYLEYIEEIISNITGDFNKIQSLLPSSNSSFKLKDIKIGSGDTHSNGRSVAKVEFDQGNVYYKPRTGELDINFFDFMDELSTYNEKFNFKRAEVISELKYSYFKEVEHKLVENQEEMEIYYEKLGYILCIMYTLNGTDFHSENIIAHGKDPVLVDLESLFHSNIFLNENLYDHGFLEIIKSSDPTVLDVGILPKKIVKNYDSDDYSLEIGGIGAEKQKTSPFKFSEFSIDADGEPRHVRKFGFNGVSENNPIKEIDDSTIFEMNIIMQKSFEYFYKWILNNKTVYQNMVSKYFSNQKIRVILRPTFLYSKLLLLSKNIYIIGNKTNREILFSKLSFERENQLSFVYSEYNQLMNYDVPIFYTNTNSLEIMDSDNNILGVLSDKTPLESSLQKINRMSLDDLDNQKTLIDQAMRLKEYKGDKTDIVFGSLEGEKNSIELERAEKLIENIGDLLLKRAIHANKESVTWISTTILGKEESEFGVGPVGNDVYLGNAGIALFLAQLYKFSGNEKYKEIVNKAINYNIRFLKQEKLYENGNTGYYNGTSGLLLSIAVINKIIPIEGFQEIMSTSLQRLNRLVKKSNNYDLFSGSSGLITCLIALDNIYPDYREHIRPLLEESYSNLYTNAVRKGNTCYWENKNTLAYVGYAHGNAGILASLIKLKSIENEILGYELVNSDFLHEISNYIDTAYDDELNNWENIPGSKKYSYGWCHGAPGLLLTQITAKECNSKMLKDESYIRNLVDIVIKKGFGANPSYCHGDLGSLKIIQKYAKVFGDNKLLEQCNTTYTSIYHKTIDKKWEKQVLSHSESLGLLIGVAGWGYSVLDHLYPEETFDFFTL
ncbi:type 2 lanthipeptide synthetase LanM [Paenibacillus sp. FSL R7-0652]|uniref:type 2 lanthipeptide synthetase LanM n=1 Tax=Paenibacillus sp. FSL R7-0652 TaxID=2921687 RepID=UPI00315A2BE3